MYASIYSSWILFSADDVQLPFGAGIQASANGVYAQLYFLIIIISFIVL